jgi:hypothetical protein
MKLVGCGPEMEASYTPRTSAISSCSGSTKTAAAGGPTRAQLTPAQREASYDARLIISDELEHCREQSTAAYLGR